MQHWLTPVLQALCLTPHAPKRICGLVRFTIGRRDQSARRSQTLMALGVRVTLARLG